MKLSELEATFVDHRVGIADRGHGRTLPDGSVQWGGFPVDELHEQEALQGADGVKFLCPKCFRANGGAVGTHLVQVFFEGSDVPPTIGKNSEGATVRWQARGSGLEDLTLSPSIHVRVGCGWHGYVTNGCTTDC